MSVSLKSSHHSFVDRVRSTSAILVVSSSSRTVDFGSAVVSLTRSSARSSVIRSWVEQLAWRADNANPSIGSFEDPVQTSNERVTEV